MNQSNFLNVVKNELKDIAKYLLIASAIILAYMIAFNLSNVFNLNLNAHDFGIQVGAARNLLVNGSFFSDVLNMNLLGEHFYPSIFLISPILRLSPNPIWINIIHNALIILCLIKIFQIFKLYSNKSISIIATTIFVPNLYFIEIFKHDFHIESLGFYFFLNFIYEYFRPVKRKYILYPILILLIGIKEDVPLVLFGFFIYQFIRNRKNEDLFLSILAFLYFLFVISLAIPYFSNGKYIHINRYSGLGSSPLEIIFNILTNPYNLFSSIKWNSINDLLKSYYYLPVIALPEFIPAVIPLIFNTASEYYVQYNLWWIHSYLILPLVVVSSAHSLRVIRETIVSIYHSNSYNIFLKKIIIPRLQFNDQKFWFLVFIRFIIKNNNKIFVWILFLGWFCFLHFPKIQFMLKEQYPLSKLITDWNKNYPVVKSINRDLKPRIPSTSRIASCGELQPHLMEYSYSGFLGLPRSDSMAFENADYLIFLEDRYPWPFNDSANYSNYKQARLITYQPFLRNKYFLVMKKKKIKSIN